MTVSVGPLRAPRSRSLARSRSRGRSRSPLARRRSHQARRTASGAVAVLLASVLTALVVLLGVSAGLAVADTTPAELSGTATSDLARTGVAVSRDGVTWGDDLTAPLWQPDLDWQPGDVRTSTLWVRNDTGTAADLEVVLSRDATGGTSDTLLTVSGARPSTAWTTVETGGPSRTIRVADLDPGGSAPVVLRASLDVTAPAGTGVDTSRVALAARVVQQTPAPPGEGWLSSAHLELAPIFLGFALIVAAVAGRRRGPVRSGRDSATR